MNRAPGPEIIERGGTLPRQREALETREIGWPSRKDAQNVDQIRILGFAGSLRQASCSRGLIRTAVELAPTDITVEVFDLPNPPFFNLGVEDAGEPPSTSNRAFDVVRTGLIESFITGVGVSRAPYPDVISRVSADSATNPEALA